MLLIIKNREASSTLVKDASLFNRTLAPSYFHKGQPPHYLHRRCVSQPSSGWVGVGPHRHWHQESCWTRALKDCIDYWYAEYIDSSKSEPMTDRTSPRSVSIPQLHTLLHFHLEPINGSSSRDLTGLTP